MPDYTYHLDEMAISLPEGFTDLSVQAFEWPLDGGERLSLVIQRKYTDKSLEDEVQELRSSYEKRFLAYTPEGEDPPEGLGHERRRHLRFRWRSPHGSLYQHQVLYELGSALMIIVGTAKIPFREQVDDLITTTLRDIQLRES